MKKQFTAAFLILTLLLTMSGCSVAGFLHRLDAAEDAAEARLDAAEDKLEAQLRGNVLPAPADPAPTAPNTPAFSETPTQAPPESTALLTQDQAQQIALDYLDLTADQVTRLRTNYEIDDGVRQFDVEFHHGDWEYEFEVHAEDGRILSFDKDHRYD